MNEYGNGNEYGEGREGGRKLGNPTRRDNITSRVEAVREGVTPKGKQQYQPRDMMPERTRLKGGKGGARAGSWGGGDVTRQNPPKGCL